MNTTRRGFFAVLGGGLLAAFGWKPKVEPWNTPEFIAAFPEVKTMRKGAPVVIDSSGIVHEATNVPVYWHGADRIFWDLNEDKPCPVCKERV